MEKQLNESSVTQDLSLHLAGIWMLAMGWLPRVNCGSNA